MKKVTLITLLCVLLAQLSNAQFIGKKINQYTCRNGWTIKVGEQILMGSGTMPNRDFAYAYTSPVGLAGKRQLLSSYAGQMLDVKQIREINSPSGNTHVHVIIQGDMGKYLVEIEPALMSGEVIPPPAFRPRKQEVQQPTPQLSTADELAKYKKLLDGGAITQEEYEQQKQKLLNK